jgi:hypothetical protein
MNPKPILKRKKPHRTYPVTLVGSAAELQQMLEQFASMGLLPHLLITPLPGCLPDGWKAVVGIAAMLQ